MTKKSDAPAIRFKGFSDAWEQRKLGELVDRVVRKNTNNESTLPLTISAQYGLVDQITYFNNRVASRDVSNYYLVLNGEFAYNKSTSDGYPFGAVKRLDLYEKGVLSTLYIVFAPKKEQQIDSDYLTVFFDTDRWHKGVAERAAEGARNHGLLNISAEDFFDIDLSVPKDIVEQKQIGAFIRQLDNLITLHQRKFEKLTNVKKSMLEKIFPQNGSSYPEIRFKGFTDPWEQRKAKEICSIGTGKSNTQDQVDDGKYPFYIRSDVPVRSNKYLYDCEAVITIGDGNIGKVFHYVNGKFDLHQRCYKMTDFKDIWGKYFFYYFSTKFYDRAMKMTAKATVDSVRLEMISEMDIKKPPQISEQKQIAEFFANLDNLITLHQRELEKLQNIKKSMLEKMFV